MLLLWQKLTAHVTLLVVSSVLVADAVSMSEEVLVFILTGLCVLIL
jgi:hypothetical protein